MNKAKYCIMVCCLLCFANAFAYNTGFGDQLSALRQAVEDLSTADKDNFTKLGKIIGKHTREIAETARQNTKAKELLINEIMALGKKYDIVDPNSAPKIPKGDSLYYPMLADILLEVDGDSFLTYSRYASKSKYMNYIFKDICFDKIVKMRISIYIKSPNNLKGFDLVMIEICSNFLDPSNGTRSRYKLMELRKKFVLHLLGYEISDKLKLPAADKSLGMKLAKEVIQDDNLSFMGGTEWFMEQAAKHDPDIHQQYLNELRKVVDDENLFAKIRLRYAKKLLELNEKLVKELEKKAECEDKSEGRHIFKSGDAKTN